MKISYNLGFKYRPIRYIGDIISGFEGPDYDISAIILADIGGDMADLGEWPILIAGIGDIDIKNHWLIPIPSARF